MVERPPDPHLEPCAESCRGRGQKVRERLAVASHACMGEATCQHVKHEDVKAQSTARYICTNTGRIPAVGKESKM